MYEDGFYIEANIIGYTGDLNNNPTVYFRNGNRFGRITQYYKRAGNIGRNKVRTYADYRIQNNAAGQAEEYYNGEVQHTSRNAFNPVNDHNRHILAAAIVMHQSIKPKYGH